MAAKPPYIPIEKRAKGKSTIFKFVSLRAPETLPDRKSLFVRRHPNLSLGLFTKSGDVNKFGDYNNLSKEAATFNEIVELREFIEKYKALYAFGETILKNKNTLTRESLGALPTAMSDADWLILWNNYFYYIFKREAPEIVEVIYQILIAQHFVQNIEDALIKTDEDIRALASSTFIVPRIVLTPKPISKKKANKHIPTEFNYVNKDNVAVKIDQYQTAIEELMQINYEFVKALNSFEGTPGDPPVEDGSIGSAKKITKDEVIEAIGNPLTKTALEASLTPASYKVAEIFDIFRYNDPVVAIMAIEQGIIALGKELAPKERTNRKLVDAGGSLIEFRQGPDYVSRFTDGCFPTIVENVNVLVDDTQKTLTALASNYGNSGGASSNIITGAGTLSFEILKLPVVGTSYHIGLSPEDSDPDANFNSIKYSMKIVQSVDSNGVISAKAIPFKSGDPVAIGVDCKDGDSIRILRGDDFDGNASIIWQHLRPSTGILSHVAAEILAGADATENLKMDFAFSQRNQMIWNVLMSPCKPDGSTPDPDEDEGACSGYTNLGVSEYLRVEQEVCCFTAGEVSHIENVMKGEYKERSTRMLRRQETTTTFESETTTEELRDTTTTDRFEMEQETSQVQYEDSSLQMGVTTTGKYGTTNVTAETGFATATSSQDASAQSVAYAQEVSSRALNRIVKRVREERIVKILEEYEENNKHGLDNRGNTTGHVTGIYRWVDKIYENQVVSYGKRMTFEFMVPEPAKFHLWALANSQVGSDIPIPEDPRENGLEDHNAVSEANYAQWASDYGVEVDPPPALNISIGKGYAIPKNADLLVFANSYNDLNIPDGYIGVNADVYMNWIFANNNQYAFELSVGKDSYYHGHGITTPAPDYKSFDIDGIQGNLPISVMGNEIHVFKANVVANCTRKPELLEQWKIDTFDKIIKAYKDQKAAYDSAVSQAKSQSSFGIQISGSNPLFNRATEQQELKKGCLSWLDVTYGQNYYEEINACDTAEDLPEMNIKGDLGCYAQKAKFFEQAFDWDIMSYLFYPYFWGKKCSWKEIYRYDDNDPIFRGFLQAGMARVIVPVKRGYEASLLYYLDTKEVWNGGTAPVVDDPLYVPLIKDVEDQGPTPVGDKFETRMPTSLNILQTSANGVAGDGLPCYCDQYEPEGTGDSGLEGEGEEENPVT